MSIKRYCDQCGTQMTDKNTPKSGTNDGRLSASVGRLMVQVTQHQDNVSNAGDYCVHCILDALYTLDNRPKVV